MTLLSPPALGATGIVLPARSLRMALGAPYRNATSGARAVPGCLVGPVGTMGELTYVSPTTYTVAPFRAVLQGTHDTTQGQYVVTNDAQATLTDAPAQDASQYRRSLIIVGVDDSQAAQVASSATTDRGRLYTLPGTLAPSNPQLPALPPNSLALGEVVTPPTGQAVTITPYNPRTAGRGGILPVTTSSSTVPGNAGAPGLTVGEYRDHPTRRLERWNGTAWEPATARRVFAKVLAVAIPGLTANADAASGTCWAATAQYDNDGLWDGTNRRFVIPYAGLWRIKAWAAVTGLLPADTFILRITSNAAATPPGSVYASAGHSAGYIQPEYEGFLGAGTWVATQYYTTKAGTNWLADSYGAKPYLWCEYLGPAT